MNIYPRGPSRQLIIDGEACRTIPLSQGKEAIVSPEDYDSISWFSWSARKDKNNWYAVRMIPCDTNKFGKRPFHMHSLICPPMNPGEQTDHRNGDGLDNRRSNLRSATKSEQQMNRVHLPKAGRTSKFRGVHFYKPGNCWRAYIRVRGDLVYLGQFSDEVSAARAYDAVAVEKFGEFARPNFSFLVPCI